MGELILIKPLFPGNGYIDQLNRIFNLVGVPDSKTFADTCSPGLYNKTAKRDFA